MLSIQQLGAEILGNTPKQFYVFGGPEYGVKCKYLQKLSEHYNGNVIESPSVLDLIQLMSVKHLIPLTPSVYVVRYDDSFVGQLTDSLAAKLKSSKIVGTVVCIYEDSRAITKLDKFFPENVASIEVVGSALISKYLKSDYPALDDRCIALAVNICTSYGHAQRICSSLSCCSERILRSMTDKEICNLLGTDDSYSERDLKQAIAAKSFSKVIACVESFTDRYDSVLYAFLSVAIELDKIFDNKWADSDISTYARKWTRVDIYNLFMQSFRQLKLLRSISADAKGCIYFLAALLTFKHIPAIEELE